MGIDSHPNKRGARPLPEAARRPLLGPALALARLLEGEMDRHLAIVGLTASALLALAEIHREPPRSQAALAVRLRLEAGSVSELLGRLERRGLIVREHEPRAAGRRLPSVATRGRPPRVPVLTVAGRLLLREAERRAARLEREWALRLTAGTGSPWPLMRAQGLRRWLVDGLDRLAPVPTPRR